jgi:hypothetical protein
MANGLVVADTSISVGGRAVLGANLARVQVGMITHTSDTALATQAAGGSQMGAAVSMVVPTAGVIRVTCIEAEFDETEGGVANITLGLKVGSGSTLWAKHDTSNGTQVYFPAIYMGASSTSQIIVNSHGYLHDTVAVSGGPFAASWDIAGQSMATSTQDIEVWLADNVNSQTGEATVTGSTKTARFLVEIIDGT